MGDNSVIAPIGAQIRRLRVAKGWTLAELAKRAGTSAPTLHRYEGGWDRFEVATLRRIARALGSYLEIRMVSEEADRASAPGASRRQLVSLLAPLFWDRKLAPGDLDRYPGWVLRRVLAFGDRRQVAAARRFFGDDAVRAAAAHRSVDPRTRNYWRLILQETDDGASESPRR